MPSVRIRKPNAGQWIAINHRNSRLIVPVARKPLSRFVLPGKPLLAFPRPGGKVETIH